MHLAGDRRRGAGAEAAVLLQHRDRDARLLGRCEGDEPGVVAQALVDRVFALYFSFCATVNTCAVPVLPANDVGGPSRRWPPRCRAG